MLSNSTKTRKRSRKTSTNSRLRFTSPLGNSPPSKKFKPLTAFAKPPTFIKNTEDSSQRHFAENKILDTDCKDDRLWTEKYEPVVEADLAVHKKKVSSLRNWFLEAFEGGPSNNLKRYRRILALTGPAGTGKTACVRVVTRELGIEILEWRNPIDERFSRDDPSDNDSGGYQTPMDHETLSEKFEAFLIRASRCQNIFSTETSRNPDGSTQGLASTSKRQIILLEDLPNILHPKTQEKFHSALESLVKSPHPGIAPIVVIVSDAGLRGEASDEKILQGGGSWGKDVVDIRSVLPPALLGSPYVTQIGFNPIAPSLLRKALQSILTAHFPPSSHRRGSQYPSKDAIDLIVETAHGDIRSAIMALQFACVVELANKRGKKKALGGARSVLEAVTRREQSLALFHLMGKVLYNKRKGDPPNSSATSKDQQRERELDSCLKDPPPPPPFLKLHNRRASRVNVDTLYSDTPIDSSLFSLYIHQNYTQFCNDIGECDGVAEWLSWVDSSGGELWHQANPHCFHLLTLGTLHSLPSPVVRRSQKFFKPEFFRVREREREAWSGVEDVGRWVVNFGNSFTREDVERGIGRWNLKDIATDIGGVLKVRDLTGTQVQPPASHRLFSQMSFVNGDGYGGTRQLGEEEDARNDTAEANSDAGIMRENMVKEAMSGGWLDSDDIEEY